jgi:hypothetical protein
MATALLRHVAWPPPALFTSSPLALFTSSPLGGQFHAGFVPGAASGVLRASGTTSELEKYDVVGCQFGALGARPVVPGGWSPSHWVVGAVDPPPIATGSARNTRSHDS